MSAIWGALGGAASFLGNIVSFGGYGKVKDGLTHAGDRFAEGCTTLNATADKISRAGNNIVKASENVKEALGKPIQVVHGIGPETCDTLNATADKISRAGDNIVKASENVKEALGRPIQVVHEIGPDSRDTLKKGSAMIGGGILGGVSAYALYAYLRDGKRENTLKKDARIIGQLRRTDCGSPKDIETFKKIIDEALVRNPQLVQPLEGAYQKCFHR